MNAKMLYGCKFFWPTIYLDFARMGWLKICTFLGKSAMVCPFLCLSVCVCYNRSHSLYLSENKKCQKISLVNFDICQQMTVAKIVLRDYDPLIEGQIFLIFIYLKP